MKWWGVVCGVVVVATLLVAPDVSAESLRIQPLKYEGILKKGERKKGYIDVTNTSSELVRTRLYVQSFEQVADDGALKYTPNEQYEAAIKLDYDTVGIEPGQTLRLYFTVSADMLPRGDIFAVIFAESTPADTRGLRTSVRVGTLLMFVNQAPGPRDIAIEQVSFPFMQLGEGLDGAVAVRNTARQGTASGFMPTVRFAAMPFGPKFERTGPLVMAGRTRTMAVYEPMNLLGVYRVTLRAGEAEANRYVAMITGYWRFVVPIVAALVAAGWYAFVWGRQRRTGKEG